MIAKFKLHSTILLTAFIFLTFNNTANAQGLLNRLKKKAENAVDKKADDILNGKKKTTEKTTGSTTTQEENTDIKESEASKGRPKLSELKDEDFIQNAENPQRSTENTRFRIAKNLMIDIKGKYPNGYQPKWRFINYKSQLNFDMENWYYKSSSIQQSNFSIDLGEYNNKAVIRINAHANCDCFADIVVKDSLSILTEKPQTYQVTNFRRILNDRSTGEPCRSGSNQVTQGGWEGKVTLSANRNGDVAMSLMLENYSLDGLYKKPTQVAYRYIAKNITIENEMSAEKANGIIAAELEAKQKYADYVKKSEKQIEEVMKDIKTKYPGYNCISCFSRSSSYGIQPTTKQTLWSNGMVTEDNDWNVTTTMRIENKCNQELTFIGIQQLYSEEKGYYYVDVSRKMEAKYYYQAKQGLFMSIFTSLAGIDGDIVIQPEYYISSARVNSIQWIKVIGNKKP
jgi:hypothetical protein